MASPEFSVCILLFGGYEHLAHRCLESIEGSGYRGHVRDFRIGLNRVSREVQSFAMQWAERQDAPTLFYLPHFPAREPAYKYPVQRIMFRDEQYPMAPTMMWFDDDSYLAPATDDRWWEHVRHLVQSYYVVGEEWKLPITPQRWEWFITQDWFNPTVDWEPVVRFPQGAWWCSDTQLLKSLDWPDRRLRHCGGDSMFGVVCRHTGIRPFNFSRQVHINADLDGIRSQSPRRGFNEKPLGEEYNGSPIPDAPVPKYGRWICKGRSWR